MDVLSILAKKRDGIELSREEIDFFIRGCVDGSIADYQASAFLMAGRINGFTKAETLALTMAMEHSGETVDLSDLDGIKVDKHSTGGVGDKVTLILMPIVAAAGLKVAKMSGRGLGHTGGTLDKMESIPGLRVELSINEFRRQVQEVGIAVISQNADLVPADKILYSLRDVTSTVDSIPLITASIMSKKLATGAQVLLLDVKCGNGAIIPRLENCRLLAENMVQVGKDAGISTVAAISDMNQPLGTAVGNALEVREALDILEGHGDRALHDAVIELAAAILCAAGKCPDRQQATVLANKLLDTGAAKAKFVDMVRAQGGDCDFSHLPQASFIEPVLSKCDGYISAYDTRKVGEAAMELGAGRLHAEDKIDPAAGLILPHHLGARICRGDVLAYLHANDRSRLDAARTMLREAITVGDHPINPPPHIYEMIV